MLDQICGHFAPAWLIHKINHLTKRNDRGLDENSGYSNTEEIMDQTIVNKLNGIWWPVSFERWRRGSVITPGFWFGEPK